MSNSPENFKQKIEEHPDWLHPDISLEEFSALELAQLQARDERDKTQAKFEKVARNARYPMEYENLRKEAAIAYKKWVESALNLGMAYLDDDKKLAHMPVDVEESLHERYPDLWQKYMKSKGL